jgi:hypothetical protein
MSAEQITKQTNAVCENERSVALPYFIPVAIPGMPDQSKDIKANPDASDISALLEIDEAEMDAESLGGIPVLVPEGSFELASEVADKIEMNAIDEEADFDDDEFEDLDDDDDEEEEEWDEEEYEEEEEEDEDEEEEEEEGEEFEEDDDDDDLDSLDEDEE